MSRFGLTDEMDRPSGNLSMGQKRRAALARLLASKSPLWLLDEPLTSLDMGGVVFLGDLLRAHLAQGGLAVVATHQALLGEGLALKTLELGVAP